MWVFPLLLDSRPEFTSPSGGSLLLAPLGSGTVLSHLRSRLGAVTQAAPVVVAGFDLDPDYEQSIRAACPDVEGVETIASLVERCVSYTPSDRMLIADPRCFPLDPSDPALLALGQEEDPRWAKHLVVLEGGGGGTKEHVDTDAAGRVRGIQRYYDAVTWPFVAGVSCSLVPISSLRLAHGLSWASLPELRGALAADGVPSRDLPLGRGALNLSQERGLLALNERLILALARESGSPNGSRPRLIAAPETRVHASAFLVGPVVLQEGAEVEEGATIIGPSVVGPRGRVGAGATVAHCIVGPDCVVAPGQILQQRALLGEANGNGRMSPVAAEDILESPLLDEWAPPPSDLSDEPPRGLVYPVVKRALDATAATLGLLLLSPVGLLIALLVKLESRGPIFFPHLREGMGKRPFRCWKFRTMVHGADVLQPKLSRMNEMDGPQFKIDRDPRLTRIGRYLTATNLDELPQLVNVLLGQMSLVGPRPSPFRENQLCVPWREGRLSVRPGITGLWQVCRHNRDKGDFHQWIYYDLLYVRLMSLWLDVKILVATFVAFARGGHVPLSWLIPREEYGERRAEPRSEVD
jgi:lipopolysaccharide/colanic/teichoic acid biosynthesis glycosyltransferase/carbonic anhydrase/acetyltransferase-like protein (isoleucine patch superfamily)